jgi:unsaturated rhamnogalacturonyl hydrolase
MVERIGCAGVAEAILARLDPARMRWHHRDALLLAGLAASGEGDRCRRFVRESLERVVAVDGAIDGWRREDADVDQVAPGRLLFDLRRAAGDPRWDAALAALRASLRTQPRTRDGGFWQRRDRPHQMWANGAWGAPPFLAAWARDFGEPDAFREAAHQLAVLEEHLRDPATGLLVHGWDESRRQLWANPETGRSACAWARGNGWFALGAVEVLEQLPDEHPGRAAVAGMLLRHARSLAGFQDPGSGLWHHVVDRAGQPGNYPECSATCLLACAFARGVRLGALPAEAFAEIARRALDGVRARWLTIGADGLADLGGTSASTGLGGSPFRDGSYAFYCSVPVAVNDHRGLGAYLLASAALQPLRAPSITPFTK